MHRLRHIRVVKLLGIIIEDENYSLVMEFMEKGNLMHVLKAEVGGTFQQSVLMCQVMATLGALFVAFCLEILFQDLESPLFFVLFLFLGGGWRLLI